MTMISLLVFLVLLAGSGYITLLFFSHLSGVDMIAAMCWACNGKQVAFPVMWCIVYLMAFVFGAVLLTRPFTLWNMNLSHEGGLLGYAANAEHAKLYDPRQKEYVDYRIGDPPPAAAAQFDKTFELVTVYKPFLSGPYQHIEFQGMWVSVIFMVFAGIGLALTCLITYSLAGEYIRDQHLARELSLALVLGRFRELTGYPLSLVLAAVSLFIILSSWIGGSMAGRITGNYAEQFSDTQKALRQEVMARVAPGKVLRGRLINRTEDFETIYDRSDVDIDGKSRDSDKTVAKTVYTVEFKGIVRSMPVYLSIAYFGKADGNPDMQFLDRSFPPRIAWSLEKITEKKYAAEARGDTELDFQVRDDYSVFPVRMPQATMSPDR